MGDMERRGKMLWVWLADFLSRGPFKGLYVSYLFASPSLSFCQLPSNKMVSYGGGRRWRQMTEKERLRAAASEGTDKINF